MRSGCCEVVWFRVGRMVAIGFSGVMHTLGCIYVSLEAESRAWRQSDASHQLDYSGRPANKELTWKKPKMTHMHSALGCCGSEHRGSRLHNTIPA